MIMVATLGKRIFLPFLWLSISSVAFGQESQKNLDETPIPPGLQRPNSPDLQLQAGIGGSVPYAQAGVLELGGSISASSAREYTEFTVAPVVGYFVANNVQASAIIRWNHANVDGSEAKNVAAIIAEPSFHMPLNRESFVFLGLGLGLLFESNVETGVAVAPRLGYKHFVGRSGMLTVDFQPIFGLNDAKIQTPRGEVITVNSAHNFGVGYTVLL